MSMVSTEKKYYLCQSLRLVQLLEVILRSILKYKKEAIIYCLEPNKLSIFIKKKYNSFLKIFFCNIAIKELLEDEEVVKNILMGTIKRRVLVDGLYKITSQIDSEMLQKNDSLLNFLNKKFSTLKSNIGLYLKQQIALGIMDDFFLIELASLLIRNPQSGLCGADLTLLLDKKNYWTRLVFEYAHKENMTFLAFNKFILKNNNAVQLIFCIMQLFVEYITSSFISKDLQSKDKVNNVGIPFYFQKNFTEFFNERNYYLFWYPESKIDPAKIKIYADGIADISIEEKKRIDSLGFRILSCNSFFKKRVNHVPRYKCSASAIKLFFDYVRQLIRLLFCVRTRAVFEQWKMLAVLFIKLSYWEDFFRNEGIKIKFKFHDIVTHRDIAAQLCGAAIISYFYTNYSATLFTILHQNISDVYFIWGEEHKRCLLNNHSNVKNIVYTGYIFDYTFSVLNNEAKKPQVNLANKAKNFSIAIMDETLQKDCPVSKDLLNLYILIFRFLLANPDISLLIKPKREGTKNILESSAETARSFSMLKQEGRLRFIDHAKYPVEAGMASDLVIGVYSNSTAALECSLAGIPAIIYECYHTEQEIDPCYRNGKNKIIFFDFQIMIDEIQKYKLSRDRIGGFADWSNLLKERDPFRDGKANKRIGLYIKTLLDAFDSGLTKDIAIRQTNRIYADRYGSDKVISSI